MKSAYLVGQGYANICKMVIIHVDGYYTCPYIRDMYHCPASHFFKIHIPLVNKPIGSYKIQSLNRKLV